ncbi:HD-GYP domain-containing protein [Shewanella atlantica]|uniref:HD-GYP domain-containing protein n=1 Tax=Shewanella atlantica TaxID=271099 RepID=UPI0037355BEF
MIVEQDISKVRVGMYVLDITWPKGKFHLVKAHWLESEGIIDGLKRKGIEKVLIDTAKTRVIPKPSKMNKSSSPSPKSKPRRPKRESGKLFQQEVVKAKRVFDKSKDIQKQLFHDAQNGCPLDLGPVSDITDESIDLIFDNPDALACVINIRHKDEYLLEHSVAVSVLITIFAFYLKIDKETVRKLAVGGFLHDVGKIMIPDSILNKPGKLTDEEFEVMKSHAQHSIDTIERTPDIDALSLEVAKLHHEKLNGKGYPNGVTASEISIYGRMISICDIFDALTSNRCYKQGYPQVKAFNILRALAKNNELDDELVDHFIKCMGVYPVGALVELDSNRLAIVESHNLEDPIRPRVKPFYSLHPNHFEVDNDIDLASTTDELIVKCVTADDYDLDMEQIMAYLAKEG